MGKIHFSGVMNVSFDLDIETNEVTNFSMQQVDMQQTKKEAKKKESKPKELSMQEKAELMECIFVNPKTQQLRFTRPAAKKLGFINDKGEVWQTPNGKNMRVCVGFRMIQGKGFMPTLSGEFDDNPTSSPMLSDSLRLTCPVSCKDVFKSFEALKIDIIPTEDGTDNIFVIEETTIKEMAELYDSIYSGSKEDTQSPDDEDHNTITDENGENANGENSRGEEFIPSFGKEESIHDSVEDDIMSEEFDAPKDEDDSFNSSNDDNDNDFFE